MRKDSEHKQLKIFNEIYNPKKPSIHHGGTQIEGINTSTHHTSQQLQRTLLKTTNDPSIRKENRRTRLPTTNPTKNLPKLKSVAKVNDPQTDNPTTTETAIQLTLKSLQES